LGQSGVDALRICHAYGPLAADEEAERWLALYKAMRSALIARGVPGAAMQRVFHARWPISINSPQSY
jgi:hypothetical protein